MLVAIAQKTVLAFGWRRRGIAFCAGAVGALSLAPINFFPAMIVPMMAAVWMMDGCAIRPARERSRLPGLLRAMGDAGQAGWGLGFGYFVAGLWWLGAAFLVEADQFAWALPLGVLGLPAVLAIYPALGFALARLLWSTGASRLLALAFGLGVSEWLRGQLFTGFPWNAFGMSLGDNIVTAQIASLFGLYGLTVLAVAIFAAPATLVDQSLQGAPKSTGRFRCRPTMIAGACLILIAAFGEMRLSRQTPGDVDGVRLRIMQPNILQDAKFRPDNKAAILQQYLSLSDRATSPTASGIADVTHLVWPESAFPFILSRDPDAIRQIAARLSQGAVLVTGAARLETTGPGNGRAEYFNSIEVVTKDGLADAKYDKIHLVPFGEYLPLGSVLDKLGIRQFVHIPGGFTPGVGPRVLAVPGLPPALPLICYEAIFPEVSESGRDRPKLILNVTNDSWFGLTSGPYQHLAQARLRTIESGLPLVRAANTGISAIVDPYGRVVASLPLGVEGVLDGRLPKSIEPTFFSTSPLVGFLSLLLASALAAVYGVIVARRGQPS